MPWKKKEVPDSFIKNGKLHQLYTSYFSKISSGTVYSLAIKWI